MSRTAGRIFVNGEDTATVSPTHLRRHIGYVIQQTGLFPHMHVEDNIAAVPRLLGWEKARSDARVDEMLALVGLPVRYRSRFPRQLSGGEQQRVGVARALAADPPIVLMDEPFGAIDAINRARLQDELISIQTKLHKTILFVTHDVEEAFKLGDRVVIMRAGKIVQVDAPLALATAPVDDFVRELIGADDMLRRLGLLPVAAAALRPSGAAPHPTQQSIPSSSNLRTALSLLLQSGADAITVVDAQGRPLGDLTFADIRTLLSQPDAAAGAP
ncbi:MAG: ABC transporter ATP-binding protein [Tetrasphaera sp.]